jgi:IMP dehydrogenase
MDTVTESELAIALARVGGLGIIHRNCSVDEQLNMVKQVKRAESFIIKDVITISPDSLVADALSIMRNHMIHGLPVVDNQDRVIGITTWRDIRNVEENLKISDVMTSRDNLVVARENVSLNEAKALMQKYKIEKLPIVDENDRLKGLVTFKDLELKGRFPYASRDSEGRLLVGAAVSPYDYGRIKKLDKYVDILVVDVAHAHNDNVISSIRNWCKEISADLIIGNIGTKKAALDIVSEIEKVDGLRVGLGSGSICITGVITKVASPTLYSTAQTYDALLELGATDIPVIADGGIRNAGDIALAMAVGASAVMMGNIFAGTKESPGRLMTFKGRYYKEYYGMGSARAKARRLSVDRYATVSKTVDEGVEGWVPYKGSLFEVVDKLVGALKASMGYVGAASVMEMRLKAKLLKISRHGVRELSPHSIFTMDSFRE